MKNFKKLVAVILAVIMTASCLSVVAFAGTAKKDVNYDHYVDGWEKNYQFFINQLLDDAAYTSWNYVDINEKAITDTMGAWTALALYDEAWRNGTFHHIDINQAELLILALIERADFYGGFYKATNSDAEDLENRLCFEYVDKIEKAIGYAQDAAGFLEDVKDVLKWDEFSKVLESEEWGLAWKIIGDVNNILNTFMLYRDEFIDYYARVLSVQAANQYYIDLVQYIADEAPNEILRNAAKNVVGYMKKSVYQAMNDIYLRFVDDTVVNITDTLVDIALNSNVYTATAYNWAMKIYDVVDSVADFLWNCDEVYPRLSQLYTAYHFQDLASDWAAESYYNEEDDSEKSYFTMDLLLTTRKVCEQSLVEYKIADDGGAVGKIKNQLHGCLYEDTAVSIAALDIMRSLMFETEPANFKKVTDAIYIYCPVSLVLTDTEQHELFTLFDGAEVNEHNNYGIFKSIHSDYNNDYLKIAFLYESDVDKMVRLSGTNNGYVTLIHKQLLADNTVADWSFTDVAVDAKTKITFNLENAETPSYIYSTGSGVNVIEFNDKFQPSQYPEYTAKDVVNAGTDIADKEVKSIWDQIVEFFEKIGQWFRDLFGIKD